MWIVVSLFGAPFQASSLPLPSAEAPAKIVGGVATHVTTFGRRAWGATGGRGVETWNGFQSDLHERYRRTEDARLDLRRSGTQFRNSLSDFDFEQSGRALTEITGDARSVLKQFASDPDAADTATE